MEISVTLLFDHPSLSSVSSHVAAELTSVGVHSHPAVVPSIFTT